MSRKGDEVRIVIHRDGLYATALWARLQRAPDGRDDVFYGRNHNEVAGQYLRASYHGSGEQRMHHPEGTDRPEPETPLADFTGLSLRWTTVLAPGLQDLQFKPTRKPDSPRRSVLQLEASELPSWPLACGTFWLVEHGREDLVQQAVDRRISRGYAHLARTRPQLVAFLSAPTQEILEGVAFAMAHPPQTW